jgi:glycerol-3-phosphate dehydrogenase
MDTPHILIIGAGELGQALAGHLRPKGVVSLWDVDPSKTPGQKPQPLSKVIPAADFVLLCVPSWAVRSVLSSAVSVLRPTTVVVSLSKGMMDAAMGQVMGELLPQLLVKNQPFAVVGGPMLATEIAKGLRAAAVFASPDEKVAERVAELFRSPVFMAETSDDVTSVSFAGVLKNIYAVALGIADGLGLDGNAKGWIVARATNEMLAIAEALNVDKQVILGTAGLADFIATAYSPYSRNREVGDEIAKSGKCNLKGEGNVSIPSLMARLGAGASKFPLLNAIKKIAIDCEPAKPLMDTYLLKKD